MVAVIQNGLVTWLLVPIGSPTNMFINPMLAILGKCLMDSIFEKYSPSLNLMSSDPKSTASDGPNTCSRKGENSSVTKSSASYRWKKRRSSARYCASFICDNHSPTEERPSRSFSASSLAILSYCEVGIVSQGIDNETTMR